MKHTISTAVLLALVFTCQVHAESASAPGQITALDQAGKTVLMADDVLPPVPGTAFFQAVNSGKAFQRIWVEGWKTRAQIFSWQVSAPTAGAYAVELVSSGVTEVVVDGGKHPLQSSIKAEGWEGWNRARLGAVQLKAGANTLTLQLPKDQATGGKVRSLELIPVAARAAYQKRVDALRSDTTWMREGKYGVMLQYGGWGYPAQGDKKLFEQVVQEFDVEKFAKQVDEDMGAKWVIWSITWRGSHFPMPLKSVDSIVPGHTTRRDLAADLAAALKKRGIKLMFYYHPGHEDPTWWAANWGPDASTARGDKARFLKNWQAVIAEIGNRYGDDLAGWFFDDGALYSPAGFEVLTKVAKSGSSKRLVSYNSWVLPTFTDFQDVHMGEMFTNANPADMDACGIYQSGPLKGNQAHCMVTVNSEGWGVWQPNTSIPLRMSAGQAIALVKRGAARGEVVSLNFDMYEDGTITPETLEMFRQVKKAIRSLPPVSEGKPATVSGEWPGGYGADKAVDGDTGTFWAFAKGDTAAWLEVDLGKPMNMSRAVICEGVTAPRVPLVSKFTIEAQQADGSWKAVANGTDIGAERTLTFQPAAARKFRLHVLESKDAKGTSPVVTEFQIFAK